MTITEKIQGTIVSVEPESVYEGVVYSQSVDVEIDQEQVLHLYDGNALVDESATGSSRSLGIMVIPTDGIEVSEREQAVGIPKNKLSEWAYEFAGTVVDVDRSPNRPTEKPNQTAPRIVLDVGFGTILVESSSKLTELIRSGLDIGDPLIVPGSRTDIIAVHD